MYLLCSLINLWLIFSLKGSMFLLNGNCCLQTKIWWDVCSLPLMCPPYQALSVFNSIPCFIIVFFYLPLWQWNVRPILSSNIYLFVHTPSSSLPVIAIIPTLLSQHPSCGHLSPLIWIPEVPSPPVSLPNELLD